MTPLRTTPLLVRIFAVAGCATLVTISGCGQSGGPPVEPAAPSAAREPADPRPVLPAPEPDRFGYNPTTRTLTFYDLPNSARWMIQVDGARFDVAAGPEHRFPETVDPDDTFVYYFRPGGKLSHKITLRQIQDCQVIHASNAAN